jgi:hypothetical protein
MLFILVEGNDDERFFDYLIKPCLEKKYDFIQAVTYATMKTEKGKGLIASIEAMKADYFFVADINGSACVFQKKEYLDDRWGINLDKSKLVLAIKEIESWYLAGATDARCKTLKLKSSQIRKTDEVTKEKFDSMIPRRFDSRIDFMQELLKKFSVPTAKKKNKSFSYFYNKHIA